MTPSDRLSARLTAGLTDLAGTSAPDYRNDILRQVARTRQRPAWTFPERWIPKMLVANSRVPGRPLGQTRMLLLIAAITLALVAGIVVAGARLLQPPLPDLSNDGLVLVPTLSLAEEWDPTTIDGLSKPSSMDIGPDGNLYVVNAGNDEILVIDPSGTVVHRWGTTGTGEGQFDFLGDAADPYSAIGGIGVSPDGSVYVADSVNDRIQQFTAAGKFVRQWGGFGPANGQFLHPFDIANGRDGSVYVVDDRRGDIQRFTADGTWLASVGSQGSGDGQLNNTGAIDVDDAGVLINADYGGHRIQAWDSTGVFLWSHPTGAAGMPVSEPLDVAAVGDGTIYVSDGSGIHVLSADLSPLTGWAPPDAPSATDAPYTVTVSPDGTAYVGSLANDRIYQVRITEHQVEATSGPSPDVAASPTPGAGASGSPAVALGGTTTTFAADGPFPIPFTLDLPPRWSAGGTSRGYVDTKLTRGAGSTPSWVSVFIPINAFADPCQAQDGPMSPPVGPTVDDLTEALTHAVGIRAGPVEDVTIDSYHGKRFLLDNNIDIRTCSDDPWLPQWTFDSATSGPVVEEKGLFLPGAEQRIAILDVAGTRVLILGWTIGSRLDEVAETYQVMDSIDFQ